MKKKILWISFLLFLFTGFTATGFCELPDSDEPDRPPHREQMERVRKRVETLKMWKLTKALDLDEKTAARLFPLLSKYDVKRAQLEYNLREHTEELRHAVKKGNDNDIKATIGKLEKAHKELEQLNNDERVELKNILTLKQQAQLILFMHEFDREMQDIIGQAKQRRHERQRNLPPTP